MSVETFEPERVRPAQPDCPDCLCCTANLCAKGRTTILECFGLTSEDTRGTVRGCPCSSEETRGTAAWRAGRLRVAMHATGDRPLIGIEEKALRATAAGADVTEYAEHITALSLRRYVAFEDNRPGITELGAAYLAARDEPRALTPVQVETVDPAARTARVIVVGWSLDQGVTVLLDQLTAATGLVPTELPGRVLEARANCRAGVADDVVLTDIRVMPPVVPAEASELGEPEGAAAAGGQP
ncbi:hypothetical protein [Streptomyces bacillaris]|uniref:hypothetical protein n=1 Tax=Streptomyces bacillaris TaxID=68179 RepID=UPI00364407B0